MCSNVCKKMDNFIDLSSGLSADYEKLYESGRFMDISIHVGKEPNSKIFSAHAVVLCARSKFFENNLTENAETPDAIQKAALTFEDVSPDAFETLLRYIYTGRLSCDLCKSIGWFNLLDGANKFELVEFCAAIETYLIDEQKEWIQQNVLMAHKYASTASLNKLMGYCNRIMVSHPDVIFKSNDLAILPKETLITLLKSDELCMAEDDIWTAVIQWAIKQVPELELGSDSVKWSFNDTNTIKGIIADCIPYIRFFNISPKTVILYDNLLSTELRRDIMSYYTDKNYKPNAPLSPPRAGQTCMLPTPKAEQGYDIDSVIINNKQAEWLSSKIVQSTKRLEENQKTSMNHDAYKLTLLYRRSRDGNTHAKFRKLCNNKGPTISVGKVLGTEEILGGYNPFAWGTQSGWFYTKKSFIFALNKRGDENIVSFFADKDEHSIYDCKSDRSRPFPCFGGSDLYFGNESNSSKPRARNNSYEVPLRHSSDLFEWADWEVFQVSKL